MAENGNDSGAARAGSQLQTQLYVNKRTAQLDEAIRAEFVDLADATFEWRSPLAADQYREYRDNAFLMCLDLGDHVDALKNFWPSGGPRWDALALVDPRGGTPGVLLIEGKSYPDEMLNGSPAGAKDPTSRALIGKALAWTQGCLGVPLNTGPWLGPLYQNANRLAHLCWLQSLGVPTCLVHLLFTGDPHGSTTAEQWEQAINTADKTLGLDSIAIPSAGHVVLPAGNRDELLS